MMQYKTQQKYIMVGKLVYKFFAKLVGSIGPVTGKKSIKKLANLIV